jgi:predicted XRE-type DNA-binding protein
MALRRAACNTKIQITAQLYLDGRPRGADSLGMSLQTLVRDRGFKQSWLASQIGMTNSTFSSVVRGKTPLPADRVVPLAKAMGVSVTRVLEAVAATSVTEPPEVA